jgi:hypothetical protein
VGRNQPTPNSDLSPFILIAIALHPIADNEQSLMAFFAVENRK